MSFAYPYILFLLLGVPVYIGLYLWGRATRRRKLRKFGRPETIAHLMPAVSPYKPPLKLTLQCLAYAMLVIALARPWGGVKSEKSVKEGIEVVICVDASNSMLAPSSTEKGAPDRMRMAKMTLEKLINRLSDDRVGLIEFAGDAYTLIPVTNDYVSAKMFLNSITPDQVANQGTNIAAAIDMATRSFSDNKDIGKAIILLTDAEELENPEGVMQAVEQASKRNIQIDVIGVGGSEPVQIPQGRSSYFIDPETGEPVRTALNEDLAIRIAEQGKGIYVNASNKGSLNELEKQMDKVAKTALEGSLTAVHDELYAFFGWLALAFILLDILVVDSKFGWLDKITFFKKEEK
ncbi:VWA domain-containing protein [bacterium]|nr:VWA domain-containing protein [bacterium]MDE6805520.1 VWA domain-containing protein [Muribaculaceae bacterium]MDE7509892.1 VWA domain-containing protein [Muribaculaceae bacterium]